MRSALRRWTGGAAAVAIVLGLSVLAGRGGSAGDVRMLPEPVPVTVHAIPHFRRDDPALGRFGPLEYLGGLEISGRHHGFGGLSALRMGPDGERFTALTDTGDWITGRIASAADGAPTGLADVAIAPILTADGRRTRDVGLWDSESLAIAGDRAFVGVERQHAILAFDLAAAGGDILRARGRPLPLPAFVRDWPENRGIEALGILTTGPYAGRLIGIAERSGERDVTTEGFVMKRDGGEPFRFLLRRQGDFDVTSLDLLPDGDMLVLERYFSVRRGVAMRIRRVRTAEIGPEAIVDGEILLTADASHHVDNMEGLSVHRSARGETLLTLVSDDNFSIAQRTLLLRFRLAER
jgi:hypothetical protein